MQSRQMQASPCACAGTCARRAAGTAVVMHQQSVQGSPLQRAASAPQALGWPHKGQRLGAMAAPS
ncbi:hypothetical protein NS331_04675 [Pseudacidovorax intermedius]|uniref:Uncharacterized protein n=1 Tax=Pseudacidovorax intermedius TaxID=433924 RepID=A0A147H727_9BURK|nr:hypothetical protein NS331_04675 [Pseudacidovorax intermedius]